MPWYVCGYQRATLDLVLSFYNVRPEDQPQVDRFDHKELKVLINLTGPWFPLLRTLLMKCSTNSILHVCIW